MVGWRRIRILVIYSEHRSRLLVQRVDLLGDRLLLHTEQDRTRSSGCKVMAVLVESAVAAVAMVRLAGDMHFVLSNSLPHGYALIRAAGSLAETVRNDIQARCGGSTGGVRGRDWYCLATPRLACHWSKRVHHRRSRPKSKRTARSVPRRDGTIGNSSDKPTRQVATGIGEKGMCSRSDQVVCSTGSAYPA